MWPEFALDSVCIHSSQGAGANGGRGVTSASAASVLIGNGSGVRVTSLLFLRCVVDRLAFYPDATVGTAKRVCPAVDRKARQTDAACETDEVLHDQSPSKRLKISSYLAAR